jgi:cytochrome P450
VALTWGLARLARLPDCAARAAEEDDYLDAVIHEILRLHPVFSLSMVRSVAAPVEIGGHVHPAGALVGVSPWVLHRRAEIYADPHEFRPERFLDEQPGTYTWIPFGGGRRRCLGASFALFELRTILATVLRAGTLSAAEPALEGDARRGFTVGPSGEGRVLFEPRATARRPQSAAA